MKNFLRGLLQLTASPWTTEPSTREIWQFGALTKRKATSSNRDPSLISTRLHYHYIGLSELRLFACGDYHSDLLLMGTI